MTRLIPLGVAGLLWGAGCSETSPPALDASSQPDTGAERVDTGVERVDTDAATCEPTLHSLLYVVAGCGSQVAEKQCVGNNTCIMWACSCSGKVLYGCHGFAEPFAYNGGFQGTSMPSAGSDCDPSASDGSAP